MNTYQTVKMKRVAQNSLSARILSGLIFIPVITAAIYLGIWALAPLLMIVVVIALAEFYNGLHHAGYHPRLIVGYVCSLLFCGAAALQTTFSGNLIGGALAISILLTFITGLRPSPQPVRLSDRAITFAIACYVGGLLSHYILMLRLDTPLQAGWLAALHIAPGAAWVYTTLAINWMQEVAAFFVGRTWGKHKIAPSISPKKSWEGSIGGMVAAVLTALFMVPLLGLPIGLGGALLLGIAGGAAAFYGDLAMSLVKRELGLKDMSNLVPGHGGVLDRIDSLLFSGPIIYYLLLLIL